MTQSLGSLHTFASKSSTRFLQWLSEENPLMLLAEGGETEPVCNARALCS